jgi:hypothetical protein
MTSNLPFTRSRRRFTRPRSLVTAPGRREGDEFVFAHQHVRADGFDSWKEIAAFLNRTVRTTQRWERSEGLPVHRHFHARGSSVYAYKHELVAWKSSRSTHRLPEAASADVADGRIKNL